MKGGFRAIAQNAALNLNQMALSARNAELKPTKNIKHTEGESMFTEMVIVLLRFICLVGLLALVKYRISKYCIIIKFL